MGVNMNWLAALRAVFTGEVTPSVPSSDTPIQTGIESVQEPIGTHTTDNSDPFGFFLYPEKDVPFFLNEDD